MSEITSGVVEETESALKINMAARFNNLTQRYSDYSLNLDLDSDLKRISVEFYLSLDSMCDLMKSAHAYFTNQYDSSLDWQPINVLRKQCAIFRVLDDETIRFLMAQIEPEDVIVDFT